MAGLLLRSTWRLWAGFLLFGYVAARATAGGWKQGFRQPGLILALLLALLWWLADVLDVTSPEGSDAPNARSPTAPSGLRRQTGKALHNPPWNPVPPSPRRPDDQHRLIDWAAYVTGRDARRSNHGNPETVSTRLQHLLDPGSGPAYPELTHRIRLAQAGNWSPLYKELNR